MKIHNPIGSKERFLEMFQGVNKVQMNEVAMNAVQNGSQLIDKAFEELVSKVAQVKQTNTQVVNDENFVEIVTADKDGNQITFTFKVNSSEGDQDGVYNVNNATLTKFKVVSQNFNVDWDENMKFVQEFNANHAGEIMNVVAEFADFDTDTTSIDDEVYEDAVKLIDKVPYKKGTETMQTNKAYADQKPTNPDLRVNATELDKFVSEMEDYVNNADNVEDFELPSDDDGSIGVDPYDQEIANAEDDWKISGKKIDKPKKAPPYMDKTGDKQRAIPSWAENFMENDGMGNTLSPEEKENYIREAIKILRTDTTIQQPQESYISVIKRLALKLAGQASPVVSEESNSNDYPDQIGKKFKTKKPDALKRKRKKPQSVVKLGEEDTIDVEVNNELEGGMADDASLGDFCPKQLAMGLEVEMEHTDDPKVALEIAMDHLTELPDYYTHLDKMETEAGVEEPKQDSDEIETDELLGYKPHNVNDYSNEEFNYAGAEREYTDREGFDNNADNVMNNKDNDIPENFWTEFQALIDEFGEKVVNYLFNNGLRGYYETMTKGNYSFDEVKRTLEMLKVPEVNEYTNAVGGDVDPNEYQGDVGDRFQDADGNQLVVNDTDNNEGGVGLQSQEGDKEIATQDLQYLKKLNEAKQVLKNRGFDIEMTKKEAVQVLIEHNIK